MSASKNILSSDVEIKGTLKFANDLIIDGRIEGEINSDGDLTVGENANLQADIRTRSVTVFGKVHGNIIVSDRCELKQNAELHGDVTAGKLAIEEGATFMGSSTVGAAAKAKAAQASAPKAENKPQGNAPENQGGGN
ncbi:MAG: polymer-forming cytoskeletal protein [Verrucomicrobiae bacterium]|nr:polymer-forming cytoskeletal protein [Verrucomicrobiae bacterium]MCP5539511.1 polymer-forming cytoskeletal protein [Akkermansiaceae bacterium]MCP5550090.1 polymer-forming cytoskeletal protein [Akkermansiaceae bacterium]